MKRWGAFFVVRGWSRYSSSKTVQFSLQEFPQQKIMETPCVICVNLAVLASVLVSLSVRRLAELRLGIANVSSGCRVPLLLILNVLMSLIVSVDYATSDRRFGVHAV